MRRPATWIVVAAIAALAVSTRFVDLGLRGMHHDEAVHAWIAQDLARGAGYRYAPAYHGPLLYHLEAVVFRAVGEGDFQARAVSATSGAALVVLLAVLLRRTLGAPVAVLAAALALASPALTYYSRFNSHDPIVLVLTLLMMAALVHYRSTGLIWFALAASLAVGTKLNAYFVIGALASYGALRAGYGRVRQRPCRPLHLLVRNPLYAGLAIGTGVLVLVLLSVTSALQLRRTAGLSLPVATIAAWASILWDGFKYWWSAHEGGRLGGPYYFYLPILAIYEPLILVGAPAALGWYMRRRGLFLGAIAGLWLLEGAAIAALRVWALPAEVSTAWSVGLLLASAWLLAGVWTTISLWEDRREPLACWVWLAVTQVLLYAYANEKVPWLLVHMLLPGIVVAASTIVDVWNAAGSRWPRVALVAIVLLLEGVSVRASWIVNTRNRSNVSEPLLQVDYTPEVRRVVRLVATQAERSSERPVAVVDSAVSWPFAWYLRDLDVRFTSAPLASGASPPLILRAATPDRVPLAGYARRTLPYYAWTTWMREVDRGDVRGLVHFLLHHDRWGAGGASTFELWLRSDAATLWAATPD